MVPAKLPTASVVTSVNGRVLGSTPETLCGMVLAGGLKLMVGNVCWKAARSPGFARNIWAVALSAKNVPWAGVVETGSIGAIQVTVMVFDWTVIEAEDAVACNWSMPCVLPVYVTVALPFASVVAVRFIGLTRVTFPVTA